MDLYRVFTRKRNFIISALVCANAFLIVFLIFGAVPFVSRGEGLISCFSLIGAAFTGGAPGWLTSSLGGDGALKLAGILYLALLAGAVAFVAYTALTLTLFSKKPPARRARNYTVFAMSLFAGAFLLAVIALGVRSAAHADFSAAAYLFAFTALPALFSLFLYAVTNYRFSAQNNAGFAKKGSFYSIASFCVAAGLIVIETITVFLPFVTCSSVKDGSEVSVSVTGLELMGSIFTGKGNIITLMDGDAFFRFAGLLYIAVIGVSAVYLAFALKNLGGADEYWLKTGRTISIMNLSLVCVLFIAYTALWNGLFSKWGGNSFSIFSCVYIMLAAAIAAVAVNAVLCSKFKEIHTRLPYALPVKSKENDAI